MGHSRGGVQQGVGYAGKMSSWRLKVINIIREKIICTRERDRVSAAGIQRKKRRLVAGRMEKILF